MTNQNWDKSACAYKCSKKLVILVSLLQGYYHNWVIVFTRKRIIKSQVYNNQKLILGKPIFSIDIHPDGSRFATGGQGKYKFFFFGFVLGGWLSLMVEYWNVFQLLI